MAVRPIRLQTLRAAAGLALTFGSSVLARRSIVETMAALIVRAPNAGRRAPTPLPEEWRLDVGPPHAVLSVTVREPRRPRATVFVLHGIRDSKASMGNWATLLTEEGYRAVLVDSRGHGRSTGDVLTYGVNETRDLVRVLDSLTARGAFLGPIGVMGHSYGAATALLWAGADARVRAAVAVSPFASFRSVVPGYLPLTLPAGFADRVVDRAGILGGFDPDAASPLESVTRTTAALLLIHGEADARIPFTHSERIARAAAGPSEVVRVGGTGHDAVAGAPQARLAARASAWFRTHLLSTAIDTPGP